MEENYYKPRQTCCIKIGTRKNGKNLEYPLYSSINPMVTVTGNSGSGKTNFSYHIIRQSLKQRIAVLIPDYSGSFELTKVQGFPVEIFSADNFPVSPFNKMISDEDIKTTSRRCADFLGLVFKMGLKQKTLLRNIIMQLIDKGMAVTFPNIVSQIHKQNDSDEARYESMNPFDGYEKLDIFNESGQSWNYIYSSDAKLYVIKFDEKYTREDQILFSELLLMSLFEWLRTYEKKKFRRKIQIHLDEAQDLNYSEKFPLSLLIRQGRKFGCSLFLYTQSLFTFEPGIREILTQAALLVNFKQTPGGAKQLARLLEDDAGMGKELETEFKHLKRGEAFASGSFLKKDGTYTNILNVKVNIPLIK